MSMVLQRLFHKADPPGEATLNARFRDLYTRVLIQTGVEGHPIYGVTSAIDGEGKTTIAAKFAVTLARDGALSTLSNGPGNILLLECNQGASRMDSEFGVAVTPGLIQCLGQARLLEEAVKQTRFPRLWVMPSGGCTPTFPVLIRTAMYEVMEQLRERFDLIVVDLPSVLTSTDTQVLADLTDHLLLVVRSGVTPAKLVSQTLDEMGREKLVGIVLNDRQSDLPAWLDSRL
jgi:protein-tyrosine kinase